MEHKLWDTLRELSDVMHFLGKNNESNVLMYLCQVVKLQGWETIEDLQKYIDSMREGR